MLTLDMVKELSSKYILARWSKRIERKHLYIESSYDMAKLKPRMEKFDNLCKHIHYKKGENCGNFQKPPFY